MTDEDLGFRPPLSFGSGSFVRPLSSGGAQALEHEDLSAFSVTDLEARITLLKAEISRCEKGIEARTSHRAEADALFSFKG